VSVATFRSAAAGYPLPITWQWQISNGTGWEDLTEDEVYSGVESPVLKVQVTNSNQSGDEFRAVATNAFGSVETDPAVLYVTSGSGII
jgi:hypothetical protein